MDTIHQPPVSDTDPLPSQAATPYFLHRARFRREVEAEVARRVPGPGPLAA